MSSQLGAALAIWRRRNQTTGVERANDIYMLILVALVAVASTGSGLWVSATSPEGTELLASPAAPMATTLGVAALWSGALLVGHDRGPALLPVFPLYVLAASDLKRSVVFRASVLRSGVILTAVTSAVTVLIGASLASKGLAGPSSIFSFGVAGALVGVVATVAWLVGQALPRTSVVIALGILATAGLGAVFPTIQAVLPWGWVGYMYPGISSSHVALAGISSLAVVLATLLPWLMNKLSYERLISQATRWQSATASASSLDFSGAAASYQNKPYIGRRIRATRFGRGLPATFLCRDLIGASRAPGRLAVGISAIIVAGILMTLAFLPTLPGPLLGVAAGLLLFAGLGPLTDGLRHAVNVAADLPLYGISDEALMGYHLLFPLIATVVVLCVVVLLCSTATGISPWVPLVSTLMLGITSLIVRVNNALKGSLPLSLLTPVPTPMGDMSVLIQLTWALDGVVLVALAGASAAVLLQSPVFIGLVAVFLMMNLRNRWRNIVR